MRWIGVRRGMTRTVLLVGPWALKLPLGRDWRMCLYGLLSNMQERAWSGLGRWQGVTLCPVVWSVRGGWLNVQRRASPLPHGYELLPVADNPHLDFKAENFGLLGGELVLLDYGEVV